ncbi:hypothetical protein [Burkholderia sp. Ac-20365]|uniref:hypothetical protein n=1 Tax=Burkholderia sp. Ac-20365 TaxID=2703897 RepID=UPI00197B84C2|nr:hypothetical protein [Burkholderia sp. Ac-20365]
MQGSEKSIGPESQAGYPEYSTGLIDLARAYDRARLSVHPSSWLMEHLATDAEQFVRGDGGLEDWTETRLRLLERHADRMGKAVEALIAAESASHFEVVPYPEGGLRVPAEIHALLGPSERPAFFYQTDDEALENAAAYRDTHHLIFYEGDGHVVSKECPAAVIEIWWPRLWLDPLVLDEKPGYGWTGYCHEI